MRIDPVKLRKTIPFFQEIEPALLNRIVPLMFEKKLHKGEMALMKPGLVRSATAETLTPTRLYALRRTDFQTLIEQDRNLAFHLLDYTMERLRRANRQIFDLTFLNVKIRTIKRLLYLSEEFGGSHIPVKITHQQLADMVGAARETVSKVL